MLHVVWEAAGSPTSTEMDVQFGGHTLREELEIISQHLSIVGIALSTYRFTK